MSGDLTHPISDPSVADSARGRWQPILTGALANEAWAAIDGIADGIRRWYADGPPDRPADATLAGGTPGTALFFDYFARARDEAAARDMASGLLREATRNLTAATRGSGLHEGYTGVVWAATHLRGAEFSAATEAHLGRVDTAILTRLDTSPWRGQFDLISGLAGLGVYARERLPRPAAVDCLTRVVTRLSEIAQFHPDGIAWHTASTLLPSSQRESLPNGWYNLGVAHGQPGIIALLSEAIAAEVAVDRAEPLLRGAISWLLERQLPAGAGARFPYCIAPELDPEPSRLAWCFGDAGIAATLLLAARLTDEPAWEAPALEIAHQAAARAFETTSINDAGICHGAAGLAHIFNRLYQATGDPVLGEAAQTWLTQTLRYRQPSREVGGFPASEPGHPGDPHWVADPGFLTGAAGVGLALLAAVTDIEPAWDRVLLVSIPPRRA